MTNVVTTVFAVVLSGGLAVRAQSAAAAAPASHDCSEAAQTDAPKALISNGLVNAVVYLPDKDNGYYRSTRFDWSGVVGCLAYKGHTYFGEWFPRYDPHVNDSITGPVEEFRPPGEALFYDQAKPGENFVKPGVGVLRRIDDKPYSWARTYPIVDTGTWTSHPTKTGVSFTQELKTDLGVAYTYTKDLELEARSPVLVLKHSFTNHGTQPLEMDVYEHDFFMLDQAVTGPGIVVHLPFQPVPEKPLQNGGEIQGNDLVYTAELQPRQTVSGFIHGYSGKASDYRFVVEDKRTGTGVEQTADQPLSRFNFWSIRTTVCPEGYIHVSVPPGQTAHWTIRYRFFNRG